MIRIAKESFLLILLIVIPFCAYLNSLDGEFVFDDSRIYNNPSVQLDSFSLKGLVQATAGLEPKTRPVSNVTFVFNYLLHKFDVRGFHLTNLIIHIGTGIILFYFLKTIIALPVVTRNFQVSGWVPFASAMIWLVHPLNTQAVSYIVQRMTSLCGFFFILAMLLYARGRLTDSPDRRFFLTAGCFVSGMLAMGSKETAVMLPVFILLYEWFFMQDLQFQWLSSNKKYLLGAFFLIVTVSFLFIGSDPWEFIREGYAIRNFSLTERVLTEFRVIFLYLGLLVFPHPSRLSLEHDMSLSTSMFNPLTTIPALAGVTGAIIFAVLIASKYRFASFCIFWFLGNHLVEGSILPLELIFEHRNYLPSMMLIPMLLAGFDNIMPNTKAKIVMSGCVVLLFASWTHQRNSVWQDRISLWSDSVQKAPNVARAHNNLAVALKSEGKFKEAVFHYRETIRLDPGFVEAYYNLGNVMMLTGDLQLAVKFYRQAVQRNPGLAVLNQSLANALFDSGHFNEALYYYTETLRLDPTNIEAKADLERAKRMIRYKRRKQRE